jgi:hypothetical protein
MSGCNRQFYYGTPDYPDCRCVDGYLWDDDDCDSNGNLYVPTEKIPCPFCHPEEYDSAEERERVASLEYSRHASPVNKVNCIMILRSC